MDQARWFFRPLIIFIFSVLALGTSLFLYIYWYVEVSMGLKGVISRFNIDARQVLSIDTWAVIVILSILVGIILLGIFTIFVYNQKTLQLYRLQHNFINNFTHELKTPVTSLKLYLETFLKHEISREDQLKYIGYMITDISRLSEHISRILNLAKIESKSFGGEFVASNLVKVIELFFESNHHLFANCQIRVHRPSESSIFFSINPPLFDMLLMNLATNAIKYRGPEPLKIDISFVVEPRFLKIRFTDNGMGMEKSERRKIFKKFYQIGRSDDMSAKGSGLGLYLVQTIARVHKGKMVAESPGPGKGSVFTLILPYKS